MLLLHKWLATQPPESSTSLHAFLEQQASARYVAVERALDILLGLYSYLWPFVVVFAVMRMLKGGGGDKEEEGEAEQQRPQRHDAPRQPRPSFPDPQPPPLHSGLGSPATPRRKQSLRVGLGSPASPRGGETPTANGFGKALH